MAWAQAIGQLVGSLGSSFMSNASSKGAQARAYNYARLLQQHQYDLAIKGFKEGPIAQREGLTSAGYNPMLALGNVGSGVNVSGGTPVSANATDTSGIKDVMSDLVNTYNQTKQTRATVDNLDSQTGKNIAETTGINIKNDFLSKLEEAEIKKTIKETNFMDAQVAYWDSQLRLQEKLGQMQYNATMYGNKTGRMLANNDLALTKAQREFIEKHPYLSGLGVASNSLLPVGAVAGGAYVAGKGIKNKFFKRKVGF